MTTNNHAHLHQIHTHIAGPAQHAFEAAGGHWTVMRKSVFEAVAAEGAPRTAYEITDHVSSALGRKIGANTIYRILELFIEHNLVSRIESQNTYVACDHPQNPADCIFLVCSGCGKTTHLDDQATSEQVRALATATGFTPDRMVIEANGRCVGCSL